MALERRDVVAVSELIDDPCPACGIPWRDLPVGHMLGIPMDGSAPSCQILPPPDPGIIDQWLGRTGQSKPA